MDGNNEPVELNGPIFFGEFILPTKQQWVWDGIDHQKNKKFTSCVASMVGLSYDTLIEYSSFLMFYLFPSGKPRRVVHQNHI